MCGPSRRHSESITPLPLSPSAAFGLFHRFAVGDVRGSPVLPPNKVLAFLASLLSSSAHSGPLRSPPLFRPTPRVIARPLASSSLPPPIARTLSRLAPRSAAPPPALPRTLRRPVGLRPSAPRCALRPAARRRGVCAPLTRLAFGLSPDAWAAPPSPLTRAHTHARRSPCLRCYIFSSTLKR